MAYLRTAAAAREVGVSVETFRRWVRAGKVAVVVLPSGERRVPTSELDRLLAPRRVVEASA